MEDADFQAWCSHRVVLPPKNDTTEVKTRKVSDREREISQEFNNKKKMYPNFLEKETNFHIRRFATETNISNQI